MMSMRKMKNSNLILTSTTWAIWARYRCEDMCPTLSHLWTSFLATMLRALLQWFHLNPYRVIKTWLLSKSKRKRPLTTRKLVKRIHLRIWVKPSSPDSLDHLTWTQCLKLRSKTFSGTPRWLTKMRSQCLILISEPLLGWKWTLRLPWNWRHRLQCKSLRMKSLK